MESIRRQKKLIHEGDYIAEVTVDLIYTDDGWSPYLSSTDAKKLDDVRHALRNSQFEVASKIASIYRLTPVHAA